MTIVMFKKREERKIQSSYRNTGTIFTLLLDTQQPAIEK